MHEALFSLRLTGDTLPVDSLAARVPGMPASALRNCLEDSGLSALVAAERAVGDSLKFRGTPYVLFREQATMGGMSSSELERRLRSAGQ
jgi:hypothetical protein